MDAVTLPKLRDILVEVRQDADTRDLPALAEAALLRLPDDERDRLAMGRLEEEFRKFESYERQPRPAQARSGHNNESGRFKRAPSLPGRGVLSYTLRFEDRSAFALGDMTVPLLDQWLAEQGARIARMERRKLPVKALREAMSKTGAKFARDLGEERVDVIWNEMGADV